MTVSSTGRVLLLEGAVDTEVELVCYRCGFTYRQSVHAEFQEEFVVTRHRRSGRAFAWRKKRRRIAAFIERTLDLNLDECYGRAFCWRYRSSRCAPTIAWTLSECGHRLSEGPAGAPRRNGLATGSLRQVWETKRRRT